MTNKDALLSSYRVYHTVHRNSPTVYWECDLQHAGSAQYCLILKKKNSTSATPLLKELHWLPIAQRIDYKCASLCFKCIHGVAPHYLREILNFYKPRRSLRSTEDSFVLETPKTKLKSFGDRAFSSYGPRIWNSRPKRIRDIDKIEIFKKQLKHHLFLKTLCEE